MAQPDGSPHPDEHEIAEYEIDNTGDENIDDDEIDALDEATGLTPALVMPADDALEFLARAELTLEGQLVDASNATLYMRAEYEGVAAGAVYKPVAGERPLWDL